MVQEPVTERIRGHSEKIMKTPLQLVPAHGFPREVLQFHRAVAASQQMLTLREGLNRQEEGQRLLQPKELLQRKELP